VALLLRSVAPCLKYFLSAIQKVFKKITTKANRELLLFALPALPFCKTLGSHLSWTSPHTANKDFWFNGALLRKYYIQPPISNFHTYQSNPYTIPKHSVHYTKPLRTLYQATPYTIPKHSVHYTKPLRRLYQSTPYTIPKHPEDYTKAPRRLYQSTPYTISKQSV